VGELVSSASAWSIELAAPSSNGPVRVRLGLDDLPPAGAERVEGRLYALALPGGAAAPAEERARAEAWIRNSGAASVPVEVLLQGDRIVWRPGFALAVGAADRVEVELAGVASFERAETELSRLEAEVAGWWPQGKADADLTHQVSARALRRWGGVNAMTAAVTAARMRLIDVDAVLGRPSPNLPPLAGRLAAELAMQCDAAHRIELIEERLEMLAELYELANDRLSEYSYFRTGRTLEIAILAVLAIEIVLLLGGVR
jgi:hypothetical protein